MGLRGYEERRVCMRTSGLSEVAAIAALLLAASPAGAQSPATLAPARAADYRRADELRFSPDGTQLAYTLSGLWSDAWSSRIWVLDLKSGASHALVNPARSERAPEWSGDGRSIRFLASRDGPAQVYEADAAGGEPRAQTASVTGVTGFHSSPDGRWLAYLATEDSCKADEHAARVADQECDLPRLWVLDPATHVRRQLTAAHWRIAEFVWRDPGHLIVEATDEPFREQFTGALYEVALADGALRLLSRPPLPFGTLSPAPGGATLALTATRSAGPIPHDLYLQGLPHGEPRDASASLDRRVVQVRWQDAATVWIRANDGFFDRLYAVRAGKPPAQLPLPLSAGTFDVARDGRIAYSGTDFTHLPEVYLREADGHIRQLTHLQEGWDGIHLSDARIFSTPSFDGRPIEAALLQPEARDPSGRFPLVLLVHGGPASNYTASYFWFMSWAQLLVARGYQVLLVNPRGSTGYGEEFLKANRADLGGGDYQDLMRVLDAVIARGDTDPARLGIGGWSYGAQMTGWAITQSARFRAAVAGQGVYDEAAEFGTEDDSASDEWYLGTPWEQPRVYARNSPMTFIGSARTPTLLLHDEADLTNPIGQSQMLYRALKALGVESRFVTYPGEPHVPRRRDHQVDALERMLEWYEVHLKAR